MPSLLLPRECKMYSQESELARVHVMVLFAPRPAVCMSVWLHACQPERYTIRHEERILFVCLFIYF